MIWYTAMHIITTSVTTINYSLSWKHFTTTQKHKSLTVTNYELVDVLHIYCILMRITMHSWMCFLPLWCWAFAWYFSMLDYTIALHCIVELISSFVFHNVALSLFALRNCEIAWHNLLYTAMTFKLDIFIEKGYKKKFIKKYSLEK